MAHCAFMKVLVVTLACCAVAAPLAAQEWSVASPDGRTTIALARAKDGRLSWRVSRSEVEVLGASPLGIRRSDQTFIDGLKFVSAGATRAIDERYTMPHGKRRLHRVRGRERTITVANASGARLQVVLRAHDDGVAFRYRFPESDATPKTVLEEYTGFRVPKSRAWIQAQAKAERYTPAYEDFYNEMPSGTAAPLKEGWLFPALFKTDTGQWLLLHESGLDGEYCASHLAQNADEGVYRIQFPDAAEGRGIGEVNPTSTLPWTMPWRVVMVGDDAGRILESDLVLDLSPPSRIKDTAWIKPGRASWSWWSASNSPKHASQLNAFVDFAAEMRWEYSLVDANWNLMESGRIQDVIAHAKEKSTGLLLWYNSGGPHNDVTEAPRERMFAREVRRGEFAKLRDWGIRGVKVDFWQSDKQDRIRQYRDLLADAAEFNILINFHGSTIPRGWSREFPHLMTMEGVAGGEQYKFKEDFSARAAWHNAVLPFTRNVVGPMDYTPVTFTDHKFPRVTTSAHELALAVVFESGIQHFADSVEAYGALPDEPKALLRDIPAAWDETRALDAAPGETVVVARRRGSAWYVGGINGRETPQDVRVSLAFLGPGTWRGTIIGDGDSDRDFRSDSKPLTSKEEVPIGMRARGGFVMRFEKGAGGPR
jgi:alpha-glucosidase